MTIKAAAAIVTKLKTLHILSKEQFTDDELNAAQTHRPLWGVSPLMLGYFLPKVEQVNRVDLKSSKSCHIR